jgi:hypothetical protein
MAIVKTNNSFTKAFGFLRTSLLSNRSHWPSHVLNTLEVKYHLRPEEMLRMWFVRERVGNGKYCRDSLLIYDREKALDRNISIGNSSDLYVNSDLLLFNGSILWDGSVYLKTANNTENN